MKCVRVEEHFNSTMVRLKDAAPPALPALRFQFHYGTIKRAANDYFNPMHIDFNSTMVRLKVFMQAVGIGGR